MRKHLAWLIAVALIAAPPLVRGDDFLRGDSNQDGVLNIADPVHMLSYLTLGSGLDCLDAADANDDGSVNVGDPIFLLFLFFNPSAPTLPGPLACGADPTADVLDCATFAACP